MTGIAKGINSKVQAWYENTYATQPSASGSATGSITTTTFTAASALVGLFAPGQVLTGTGVTAGTVIVNQLTGPVGGLGTYTISPSQSVASTTISGQLATENVYFVSFQPNPELEQVIDMTMAGGLRGQLQPILGKKDIGGTVKTVLAPQSCVKHLAMLLGAPAITNLAAGRNQFVFAAGSGAAAIPVGLGMEIDYGSNMATPGRFLRLAGLRYSKGTFTFNPSGFVDASYDLIGSNWDWAQSATINATPSDFGHTGFSMFVCTLQEGGSSYASGQQLQLTWDNDLDNSLYTINAGGVRGQLPEGMVKISGTLTALFDSQQLLTKALANTGTSLNLTFTNGTGDGSAGNDNLVINIPNLVYKLVGPTIDGPKGLMQKLAFTGFRAAGSEQAAAFTLKTPRATS